MKTAEWRCPFIVNGENSKKLWRRTISKMRSLRTNFFAHVVRVPRALVLLRIPWSGCYMVVLIQQIRKCRVYITPGSKVRETRKRKLCSWIIQGCKLALHKKLSRNKVFLGLAPEEGTRSKGIAAEVKIFKIWSVHIKFSISKEENRRGSEGKRERTHTVRRGENAVFGEICHLWFGV